MRRVLWLALAAALYVGLALTAAPGFYDGISGPPPPYRFNSPPPGYTDNQAPMSAHKEVGTDGARVLPDSVFTDDGQAQISFVPDAYLAPASGAKEVIDLKPTVDFPAPSGFTLVTNVYCVTSSTPLKREATLTLQYSDKLPAPSTIWRVEGSGWAKLDTNPPTLPYYVTAQVRQLGCFGAGYANAATTPGAATPARVGGGQTLPIVAAIAVVVVILASLPLALRRRRARPGK